MNESDASSNYWLLWFIYVCHLLNHIVYSKDPQYLTIALRQMEGGMDHQLDPQKVHNRKYYQQESLMASSDPDVIGAGITNWTLRSFTIENSIKKSP